MKEMNRTTNAKEEDESMLSNVEEDNDEHGCKDRVLQKHFLQEWTILKSMLDLIVSSHSLPDLCTVHKIRSILDKYQEQGQLLEPYLETIVSPLMLTIRSKTMELGPASHKMHQLIKPLCIIIYSLVTVCGYKSVVRFFPHQVSDLELAVSLSEKCHEITSVSSLRQESTGEMEAKCVSLLWLSILVLLPFDMTSLDSSILNGECVSELEPSPIVMRILRFCKDYLSNAGPMRPIAGFLLSRLVTRPDTTNAFTRFIEWTHGVLSFVKEDIVHQFKLLGAVEALACTFKVGKRKLLLDVVPIIWNDVSILIKSSTSARSPLLRKHLVKLAQRIGLISLPHRSLSWHYIPKTSSLGENILLNSGCKSDLDMHSDFSREDQTLFCLQEEDMYVPEIVEDIIELLLSGLRDKDTIVRWSAAKGLGRITFRLTSDLSDEVLSSVLELFSPGEGDCSWHGGCLALAELARRGLLLPLSLPKVGPVVIKALHYDIRRGSHSVGYHVRDAAAYVCWAFARAYYNTDIKTILEQITPHLLTVACYDREVNCRRAASAAFQENVGRQGDFPHGIDIVNAADYFSLSSRVNSYIHVAECIAQYDGYLRPFVDELLHNKICHWDKGLRELAAEALSALVKYDSEYFSNFVLGKLILFSLSSDLGMRHGATLAAGELVLALYRCGYVLSDDKQKSVAAMVPDIEKACLYRGKGGEIMRASVSRFIECISLAHVALPEKTKLSLLDALNENLRHPNSQIQNAAVKALKHFVPAYLSMGDKCPSDITLKHLVLLKDPNAAARRGSALSIGVLPYNYLTKKWRVVLLTLCNSCLVEENPEERDAESRVNAVKGLVSVCETLITKKEHGDTLSKEDDAMVFSVIKNEVMTTLFKALDDYSVDNRGDVGSWVREAAMDALERCTYLLCKKDAAIFTFRPCEVTLNSNNTFLFDEKLATNLVGAIVKQAVEKMDKIREAAVMIIQRILYNEDIFIPFIPFREKIEELVPNSADLKWEVPALSYPRFVQLLQFNCYSKFVLSGLIISVGGLQDSLRKASVLALVEYLQVVKIEGHIERSSRESMLCSDILWVLQHYKKCDRVTIPALKTIEILFSKKLLNMEALASSLCGGVLDLLAVELKGSKDFTKLYAGIAILGYIASLEEPINTKAFSQLLTFLSHRYPKIRKASADQVYLVLLQNSELMPRDNLEKALEIIEETCWEDEIEVAKNVRSQLCDMASLQMGFTLLKPAANVVLNKGDLGAAAVTDENALYSSLVDSTGF